MNILRSEVISDYREAYRSRQVSLIGRREVLTGKAKFGIFGGGKELPQLAMAKVFKPGDFRAGYYRDQTLHFVLGMLSYQQFFAQLYADPEISHEPASGGRQMNAHFATRLLNSEGEWFDTTKTMNSSADVSPTASQMPRLVGLAQASKLYRQLGDILDSTNFSRGGDEIAFGTIGNASSAEGLFWESINAISVLQAPALISIFDDEYGISVSNKEQFGKSLGELLSGFEKKDGEKYGYHEYSVKGWDYPGLLEVYSNAEKKTRQTHEPSIIHVIELTQPQGHSTSGSHERYKSEERLTWESEHDCLVVFRNWIIDNNFASEDELQKFEKDDASLIEEIRLEAWESYKAPIIREVNEFERVFIENQVGVPHELVAKLRNAPNLVRKDILEIVDQFLRVESASLSEPAQIELRAFRNKLINEGKTRYGANLYSVSNQSAVQVAEVEPIYSSESPILNGFEILNKGFEGILEREPSVIAFGEDLGKIGGVNQGFAGLQEKFGEIRVSDTGIREATIIGQAIGLAMRGFRPIAEIQYLDYVLYALQLMSDDLATVQWRSVGGQKAPVIIRTRGHRLEGIWHSGSPMGALINLLRGMYVIAPRNMVQAIGFYNTLIKSDEPGIVVEVLNGYRQKERLPDNIDEIRFPLGIPEIIREGSDVSIVTYGALCSIALQAADSLNEMGIDVEIIDVRTLLPFDIEERILGSIKKTNRVLFLDEDVPGGCTAYMMQQVVEGQGGYYWLDSAPRTLSAAPHRPAYGADGNYFSKPNKESIIEIVYEMMRELNPARFRNIYE
jgi:pyruvate/2-oxoglutarate/acetoin dehydrogenase E1 component/TPP-dependent pyruvate/acetoin dehydrogenase alpha subunit